MYRQFGLGRQQSHSLTQGCEGHQHATEKPWTVQLCVSHNTVGAELALRNFRGRPVAELKHAAHFLAERVRGRNG